MELTQQEKHQLIRDLSAAFPDDQVFHRTDERTKKQLSYISASNVYTRLNEAAPGWNFAIINVWFQQIPRRDGGAQQVMVVSGELSIPGLGSRSGFGSNPIYAPDDYKVAGTDCLKKCASLFGIGLYLYGESDAGNQQQGYQQPYNQQPYVPVPQNSFGGFQQLPQQQRQQYPPQNQGGQYGGQQQGPRSYDPSRDSGEMATQPQRNKIGYELGRVQLGIHEAGNRAQVPVGDGIDSVTKAQAMVLIDWLTNQKDGSKVTNDDPYDADINNVPF